jgi:hypothetical protein
LVISPQAAELTMPGDEFASWKDLVEAGLAKLQSKMAKLMEFASDYGGKADDNFVAITFETIDTTFEIPKPKKMVPRKEIEKIVDLLRIVMATGDKLLDARVFKWEEWEGSIVLLISAPQATMNVLFPKLLSVKGGNGFDLSDHMPQSCANTGRRYRVAAMVPVFLWTIKDPAINAAMQTLLNVELANHNTDGAWFNIEPISDAATATSAGAVPPRTAIRCLGKYRPVQHSPKVAELKKLLTVSHVCDTIALVDDGLLVEKLAAVCPSAAVRVEEESPQIGGGPAIPTEPSAPVITTGAAVGGEGKRPRSPTDRTSSQLSEKKLGQSSNGHGRERSRISAPDESSFGSEKW